MGGPYLFGSEGWKLVPGHFAERHGLIVIIALGESIVAIGVGAAGQLTFGIGVAAVLGVALTAAMWWTYFDIVAIVSGRRLIDAEPGKVQNEMARDSYSYVHLLMIAGTIMVALGLKKTIGHFVDHLHAVPAFALLGGVALYLLGHVLFRYRHIHSINRQRLGLAIVLLILVPVAVERPTGATNVAGSGPVRSPASRRAIAAISSSLSSKSKTSMFSRIRSGVTDLGMTTLPSCRCQRRIAWAGVLPWRAAISTIVSSSSRWPCASGLQASVAIPCSACQARSSACWRRGCSSIWLTVGRFSVSLREPLEVLDAEVGDADRARAAFVVDPFEGPPGVDEAVLRSAPASGSGRGRRGPCRAARGSSRRPPGSSRSPAPRSRAWW